MPGDQSQAWTVKNRITSQGPNSDQDRQSKKQ